MKWIAFIMLRPKSGRGVDEVVWEIVRYRQSSSKGTANPLLLPPSCFLTSVQVKWWCIRDWDLSCVGWVRIWLTG